MVFLVTDKEEKTTEVYSTNSGDDNVEFVCDHDLAILRIRCLEIKFDMQVAYEEWMKQYSYHKQVVADAMHTLSESKEL